MRYLDGGDEEDRTLFFWRNHAIYLGILCRFYVKSVSLFLWNSFNILAVPSFLVWVICV